MAKDNNGIEVQVGDELVCKQRSIIICPMCTSAEERPYAHTKVYNESQSDESSDQKRIRRYNSTMTNSVIHRDVILEKKDLHKGDKSSSYIIVDISGEYALLKSSDSSADLRFYHPLNKFVRIRKGK
jgi:hypothetical protein